jgi:hypothetical protein
MNIFYCELVSRSSSQRNEINLYKQIVSLQTKESFRRDLTFRWDGVGEFEAVKLSRRFQKLDSLLPFHDNPSFDFVSIFETVSALRGTIYRVDDYVICTMPVSRGLASIFSSWASR